MVAVMGLFSKKIKESNAPKAATVRQLSGVPVSEIVDIDTFVDSTHQGKETTFRIVRFTEEYPEGHLRFEFGNTHQAIVVRGKGTKEYEALLGIADRVVIKSFVDKFYG